MPTPNVDLSNYHYARADAGDPAHPGAATNCKACLRIMLQDTVLRRDHVVERELVALKDELGTLVGHLDRNMQQKNLHDEARLAHAYAWKCIQTAMERAYTVSHA